MKELPPELDSSLDSLSESTKDSLDTRGGGQVPFLVTWFKKVILDNLFVKTAIVSAGDATI